jgi:hypothetical protein
MFKLRPLLLCLVAGIAYGGEADTDRDGLSDEFEQALLERFAPRFHISEADCDVAPAEFVAASPEPRVTARNGTVYGQVFPVRRSGLAGSFVEIHFYHLWAKDCGMNGHALDAESVYALLWADGQGAPPEMWRAEFWLAAAHENTLCDLSTGASAAALAAVDRGPDVWVSRDKHASFLSRKLCSAGCGNETCDGARAMRISKLINLGEPGLPMNDAVWAQSASWPLASKMTPHYTGALIARMPAGAEVELVPAREVVRGTRSTVRVAGRTYGSFVAANASTGAALEAGATGAAAGVNASRASMRSSAGNTRRSLKAAFSSIERSLRRAFRPPT